MKSTANLGALALCLLFASPAWAEVSSKTSDVKPIANEDQRKLNKAIGNEQDAKIKVAPIGQSDKDNINKAVNWVEEKLKIRPLRNSTDEAAKESTAETARN